MFYPTTSVDAPLFKAGWYVPRSLVSQRVKIPPALFTRICVEANSGRVSLVRGNLKSLRRSLARSKSEPVVGYAKRRPFVTLGEVRCLYGDGLTVCNRGPKNGRCP
jgi:hypothetical protein